MLRYTGLFLAVTGIIILVATLIKGRQKGIGSDRDELAMITSSGYVSERTPDEKKAAHPFEGQLPLKQAPKKKRVLSEEARSILEQVESDRARQAAAEKRSAPPLGKGTDVLPGNMKRSTAILHEKPSKGTAVLDEKNTGGKGTAVLPEGKDKKKKGTAVLGAARSSGKKGTDILQEKGTAVLAGSGTAVLEADENDGKRGADILNE